VSLPAQQSLDLIAAHLDHQLRGDDSTADASFVRQLCSSLGVPLVEHRLDIRHSAEVQRIGIEQAARDARYKFLTATANEHRCPWVVVAHTADDQAETVLHHILRGTGIDGMSGIPRIRPLSAGVTLARPLLDLTRAQIEEFLRAIGQAWRDDTTNSDSALTRNSIRHELLPTLRERYNPQIVSALFRLAQQARELQAVIDPLAERLFAACRLDAAPDVLRLNTSPLADQRLHLVREVLKRAWRTQNWPMAEMGYDQWTTLALAVRGEQRGLDFPGGVHAERRGTLLVLTRKTPPQRVETGPAPG
jgi:tRNA(Ile)-lysidine synthase